MESELPPSRTRRKLAVTLIALTVLVASACSHHNNNASNTTTNNTTNNTTSENATTQVFGATFATDLSANADSTPANVAPGDITPVSNTTFPVAVNSMGAVNTTGQN